MENCMNEATTVVETPTLKKQRSTVMNSDVSAASTPLCSDTKRWFSTESDIDNFASEEEYVTIFNVRFKRASFRGFGVSKDEKLAETDTDSISLNLSLSLPGCDSVLDKSKLSDCEEHHQANNSGNCSSNIKAGVASSEGTILHEKLSETDTTGVSLTLTLSSPFLNPVLEKSILSDSEGSTCLSNSETTLDVMPLNTYFPDDVNLRGEIEWTIKKVLTKSDCDEQHRLLISRKLAEQHILSYLDDSSRKQVESPSGLRVTVFDIDEGICIGQTLKRWPSTGSIGLMDNWRRDFVQRRGLTKGDEVGLRWEERHSRLLFSVLRKSQPDDA